MNLNTICLYWLDKNWKGRGGASHHVIFVDFAKKRFSSAITFMETYISNVNAFEVTRKTDLKEYADALRKQGFAQQPWGDWDAF